jgi:hypothetical protein
MWLSSSGRAERLDLFDQEIDQRPAVSFSRRLAAVGQEVRGTVVRQQVGAVDDGDHRVEPRDIGKALAILVAEVEGMALAHQCEAPEPPTATMEKGWPSTAMARVSFKVAASMTRTRD